MKVNSMTKRKDLLFRVYALLRYNSTIIIRVASILLDLQFYVHAYACVSICNGSCKFHE